MIAVAEKLCRCCLESKPAADFRRRRRNGEARLNECRTCHAEAERQRRALARRAGRDRKIAAFARELKNERNGNRAVQLCAAMIAQFGGPAGFAAAWFDQVEAARKREPGCKRVLDALNAIARLWLQCSAQKPEEPLDADMENLTDEDLRREIVAGAAEAIRQNPMIAIAAADKLGWTIIPPDEDGSFED